MAADLGGAPVPGMGSVDAPQPQPTAPSPPPPPAFPRWGWWCLGVTFLVMAVGVAGFAIHVPYSTISPGAAVKLPPLVSVNGTTTYTNDRGDLRLLFVRERNHINLWRYLQARLDDDIDMFKDKQLNPFSLSQTQLNGQAAQEMADAKTFATKVALEAAGYKVKQIDGLTVSDLEPNLPASKVLQYGDVILRVDGKKIVKSTDLRDAVQKHNFGDKVRLDILRDGEPRTVDVAVGNLQGHKIIGVDISPRYAFPVKVNVDTEGIGGPSAGLAMTLAIFDDLTPGNLAGGKRVAVTGTIDADGNVGEIGGINQKAVAARAAGAQMFIVPQCAKEDPPDALAACQKDLRRASERAGSKVKVVPVSTFTQALQALRAAGGDPVVTSTTTAAAA